MKIEDIARVCHEVNRAYCRSFGDLSQVPWDEAPTWQRATIVSGVLFHIRNPYALPSDSHERWMAKKYEEGWLYGPTKDPVGKTHPCMLPFEELTTLQRAKDYIFKAVVNSLQSVEGETK